MKIDQKNARIMNMILDFAKSSWIKTTRKLHQERKMDHIPCNEIDGAWSSNKELAFEKCLL